MRQGECVALSDFHGLFFQRGEYIIVLMKDSSNYPQLGAISTCPVGVCQDINVIQNVATYDFLLLEVLCLLKKPQN